MPWCFSQGLVLPAMPVSIIHHYYQETHIGVSQGISGAANVVEIVFQHRFMHQNTLLEGVR